jgi:hypothetical protein
MSTSAPLTDPVALIDGLDAAAIARRLDALHHEEAALRVLLRAARARERREDRARQPARQKGVCRE